MSKTKAEKAYVFDREWHEHQEEKQLARNLAGLVDLLERLKRAGIAPDDLEEFIRAKERQSQSGRDRHDQAPMPRSLTGSGQESTSKRRGSKR
jgi:hypothetical protein